MTTPAAPNLLNISKVLWTSSCAVIVTEDTLRRFAALLSKGLVGVSASHIRVFRSRPDEPEDFDENVSNIDTVRGDPVSRVIVVAGTKETYASVAFNSAPPYTVVLTAGLGEFEERALAARVKQEIRSWRPLFYWRLTAVFAYLTTGWRISVIFWSLTTIFFACVALAVYGFFFYEPKTVTTTAPPGQPQTHHPAKAWYATVLPVVLPFFIMWAAMRLLPFMFPPVQFLFGNEGRHLRNVRNTVRGIAFSIIVAALLGALWKFGFR